MTTATPTRHRWTKDEISHMKRVVGHAKTKKHGFEIIAQEMSLPVSTVSAQYANITRKKASSKPVAATNPRSRSGLTVAIEAKQASKPMQDFSGYSDRDLLAFGEGLKFELARRREQLSELEGLFTR